MTQEQILASLADAEEGTILQYLDRIKERIGPRAVFQHLRAGSGVASADPFLKGLRRASELPAATAPTALWHRFYPASVVLFIGETGAGKSSFLYNLALHAALGEPLFDVPLGVKRRLVVLYVDPENAGNWDEGRGGVCAVRLERIGRGRPEGLIFHHGLDVNLSDPAHMAALREHVRELKVDLLILDPIANLFGTEDENNNAEAARQMKDLTTLSRETGVCVVACHHTGKDTMGIYGRGASARLAAADVGMVFRVRGKADDDDDYLGAGQSRPRRDVVRLQVVKNRFEGGDSLFLRMAGDDRFERIRFQDWKSAEPREARGVPKADKAFIEISHFLQDGKWHDRAELESVLEAEGIGVGNVGVVMKDMVDKGVAEVQKKSHNRHLYRLKPPSPVPQFSMPLSETQN